MCGLLRQLTQKRNQQSRKKQSEPDEPRISEIEITQARAHQRRFELEWWNLFASWVKDRAEDILDHTAAIFLLLPFVALLLGSWAAHSSSFFLRSLVSVWSLGALRGPRPRW